MYCSSCGAAVVQGLSYCNHCGAKLGGTRVDDDLESSQVRPGYLVFAMMASFFFGLLAITVLMGVMKAVLGLSVGWIVAFTLLSFLIMLVLEGVFIRLLLHRKRAAGAESNSLLLKKQATKELDAAQPRVLQEPMPSVTEHTTRAFEPIQSKRTSE